MLIARATSKQVIVEQTATSVDSSTEIQHGTWIVANDNLNFHKKVFPERVGRHDESRDFYQSPGNKLYIGSLLKHFSVLI